MTKPSGAKAFAVVIIFCIALPLALFKGLGTSAEYAKNGKDVTCTVVETFGNAKHQSVKVEYKNDKGETVLAECTANKRVSVGEKLTGKVLADKPNEVYCPPSAGVKIICTVVFGGCFCVGIFALFTYISSLRRYDLLMKKGIPTSAEVVSTERYDKFILATLRFITADGEEAFEKFTFERRQPQIGDTYNVVYFKKPNGKVVSDIIGI